MSGVDDQRVFMCAEHQFVMVVRDQEATCRGTPGRRGSKCAECDRAVEDALLAIGWDKEHAS